MMHLAVVARPLRLEDVFFVGKKTPIDPAAYAAFEAAAGCALPARYREVLDHLGVAPRGGGRAFCGALEILPPDRITPTLAKLDAGARGAGEPRFFASLSAPNFNDLFTPDDAANLRLLALSTTYEYLVMLPGLDELFYFYNPRSRRPIEIAGTDMVAALGHWVRANDVEVPYFVSGEGVHFAKVHDDDTKPDWTSVFFHHAHADLVCEGQWNYFFRAAEAIITVQQGDHGVDCYVRAGKDPEALIAWLRAFVATPDLSEPSDDDDA